MSVVRCAPHSLRCSQDNEGHLDYWATYLLVTNTPYGGSGTELETDYPHSATGSGPFTIGNYAGLPSIGDPLIFGDDQYAWARCHPDRTVQPYEQKPGENSSYTVEIHFSTRPLKRCMTSNWANPLLEPQKVSGSYIKGKVEATKDRHGKPIKNSSHEMYRGPQVEFDSGHSGIHIEQNVLTLQLALCTSLMDHVNDDTLWGLVSRRVKLSNFTWEEKWYDVCSYYYTRIFDFEIKNNPDDLWDRKIIDEGTKVLNGKWSKESDASEGRWITVPIPGFTGSPNPDPANPSHFCRYKDRNDENSRVILNGAGKPAESTELVTISGTGETGTDNTGAIGDWIIEYYRETDFTILGIPTEIDFGTGS